MKYLTVMEYCENYEDFTPNNEGESTITCVAIHKCMERGIEVKLTDCNFRLPKKIIKESLAVCRIDFP